MLLQLIQKALEKEKEYHDALSKALSFDSGYSYYRSDKRNREYRNIFAASQTHNVEWNGLVIYTNKLIHTPEELKLCSEHHLFYHENPVRGLELHDKIHGKVLYSTHDLYRDYEAWKCPMSLYNSRKEWFEVEQSFDKSSHYTLEWLAYCLENYSYLWEEYLGLSTHLY